MTATKSSTLTEGPVLPADLVRLAGELDRPAPRYTSYPTALSFTPEVNGAVAGPWIENLAHTPRRPLGLYVHVPFCREQCDYCGCHVIPLPRREPSQVYLEHLEREIRSLGDRVGDRRSVTWVHLGGGTPTYLHPEELERLFGLIRESFPFEASPEISIEIDPRVTTPAHLESLARVGCNRLSLGVQDFSAEVQEAIGRRQSFEQTREIQSRALDLGLESINLDLVYGLPRQTPESLERTLDLLLDLAPSRLAFYSYAHLPAARRNQRSIDSATVPGGVERLRLFLLASERLRGAGYEPIGMDHFALPLDPLAHAARSGELGRSFMGYTPHGELEILGLGPSSISSLEGGYFQNHKKLGPWYRDLREGLLPVERGVPLTPDDRRRRWIIHQLLGYFEVTSRRHHLVHGIDLWEGLAGERLALEPLEERGLVEVSDSRVRVTERGRLFVRHVASAFDAHLASSPSIRERCSRAL